MRKPLFGMEVLGDGDCRLGGCLEVLQVSHQSAFYCQEDFEKEWPIFVIVASYSLHLAGGERGEGSWGRLVHSGYDYIPEISGYSLGENDISKSYVFKTLVELNVESAVALAIVEG